jgi:hypothetical protein
MKSLPESLKALDSILIDKNAPLIHHFNPGLPKEEVISFLQFHQITPIPSLVMLYEWHNGVKTVYGYFDSELELFPFGKLFNLDEMLQMREIFREWAEDDFDNLNDYIPFMGSGESDMFILNILTGEVLGYQPMIQIVGELEFRSIEAMINCILECFESNAYQMDHKKGLIIDWDKYEGIKKSYLTGNDFC